MMMKRHYGAGLLVALFVPLGAAQNVTGTGTPGSIPIFTGTSTLNSSTYQIVSGTHIGNGVSDSVGDTFSDSSLTLSNYGLSWQNLNSFGPSAVLSGWGGINLYTQGTRRITVGYGGLVGMGTSLPQALFHLNDVSGIGLASLDTAFGSANAIIQSSYGARTVGTGAALSFAVPANTDGSNPWEQARILATPDNSNNQDAHGRMYLQTRTFDSSATSWVWSNNLLLTSGGNVTVGGNLYLSAGSGAAITIQDGTVQSTAYTGVTCGGDYAESVDVAGQRKSYEPGDVLVISTSSSSDVTKSDQPYSTLVAGVYSTKPGIVGRRQTTVPQTSTREVPMAMIGIVPTKVSAENGPIKRGDILVTSSTPGYAMKGTNRKRMSGAVVGKALGSLDSGKGVIEGIVMLQ